MTVPPVLPVRYVKETKLSWPMAYRSRKVTSRLLVGAGIVLAGAVMAALTFGFFIPLGSENEATFARVGRTRDIIEAVDQLLLDIEDIETSARGFLLSEDSAYVAEYRLGSDAAARQMLRLQELKADSPVLQEKLQDLVVLIQNRQVVLNAVIEHASSDDLRGALAIVPRGEGSRVMSAIRQTAGQMIAEERHLLRERVAQARQLDRWVTQLLVMLGIIAVGGVLLSAAISGRAVAATRTARRAMQTAAERKRVLDMVDVATVMVLHDFDGTIHLWSEGCRRLYGWTAEQAIGRVFRELLHTVYPVPQAAIDAALLRDGRWHGELRQRTRDGTELIVIAAKVLHDFGDGQSAVIVTTMTDVTTLRQAEVELRKSEAQFQRLVDTAADGFVIAHSDGRIQSVNQAMLDMFGYVRSEELIGQNLGVLMPVADSLWHDDHIAAHNPGSTAGMVGLPGRELVAVRRDGSEFPIDLSVSSFSTDSLHVTGIVRDVSARKQAEAALRESETRLRLVQQVGGIAYADRLLSDDTSVINGSFVSLYGLPPEQTTISTKEWLSRVHPDDRKRVLAERRQMFATGERSLISAFRICRPDGSVRWIEMRTEIFPGADGQPVRIVGAQRDITDIVVAREAVAFRQQQLEQRVSERTAALAEAEARFHEIFDSQFQLICLLAPDSTILEMNRTALDAVGVTRQEILGLPVWQTGLWPEADREQLRQDVARAAQGGIIRREVETRGADGKPMWLDFSFKPVRDQATNAITSILAEGRDLTEKHNLITQLAQSQKVQALGQLAGGIAHDFNNILQTVSGAARLIEQRPDDEDRTRRLAHTVATASSRGTSITQRLLSFARRGELRAEPIDTGAMLNSVREVLAHTLGTTITVCVKVPPDVPPLIADLAQLETAIINLSTNARDAMPNGGKLILSAEPDHVSHDDHHPDGLVQGDYVRLSVADNGTGMDPATFARASEPFFTTKPPGMGTGLGLAMVRGFAEQSGGALSISSSFGMGTTVSVWLRQATGESLRTCYDELSVEKTIRTCARILLVDDDDLVRETLSDQLESLGFSTLLAAGGHEAIALLEGGEVVDAMVSDLSMPGLNGVMTIQKARELRPGMPCFLLTGYVGERAALSADNAFTLVRKPVPGQILAAQIEAAIEGARH